MTVLLKSPIAGRRSYNTEAKKQIFTGFKIEEVYCVLSMHLSSAREVLDDRKNSNCTRLPKPFNTQR